MNLLKKIKQNQGFTLIELMLAIGFLGVLTVIALPNLSQFVQTQKLKSQAEIISSTFSVARSEALSRLSNVNVCWNPANANASRTVSGYQIQPGRMAVIFPSSTAEIIRDVDYAVDGMVVVDDENDNCATYTPQGRLLATSVSGTSLIFGVCRATSELDDSRSVEISATGRPVVKENVTGSNTQTISCS